MCLPLGQHYANATGNTEIDKNRPNHRGAYDLLAETSMLITANQNRIKYILLYMQANAIGRQRGK